MDENKQMWDKCTEFHGHICGGLAIGYQASLYAIQLLNLSLGGGGNAGCLSKDEEIVCITESDGCSCDAFQVILGTSIGKGNLLFHICGKQAFSFYDRNTGRSVRLVLNPKPEGIEKGKSLDYYLNTPLEQLFSVTETRIPLPEKAGMFASYPCDCCGELTGTKWLRIMDDKKVCLDCYHTFDRFQM